MFRLMLTSLLAGLLSFGATCVGLLELYLLFVPPKPGQWGADVFLLGLIFVCGLVAAIVGGMIAFSVGSQSTRTTSRWDLLGWLIGLAVGLGLSMLIPNSFELFYRCWLAGIIIPLMMLVLPPAIQLLVGGNYATENEL